MVGRYLFTLTALLCCVKDINGVTTYTMFVNGNRVTDPNGVRASAISVSCHINTVVHNVILEKIDNNGQASSLPAAVNTFTNGNSIWKYQLNTVDRQATRVTYRCRDNSNAACPHYVQVTISSSQSLGPTIHGCPPSATGSDSPPPVSPSSNPATQPTSSGGTGGPKFAGLNPLIYTISAVILLGTLAIVAIITCWIRARRSYNRRMFQATTNPQDYLDYISDNEFTPLTTSEFVASLQERPPTYHESEEIEGQTRPKSDDEDSEGGDGGDGGGGGGEREGGERSRNQQRTSSRAPPPRPPPPPPPPTNSNSPQPTQQSHTSNPQGGGVRDVATTTIVGRVRGAATTTERDVPNEFHLAPPPSRHGDQAGRPSQPEIPNTASRLLVGGVDDLLSGDLGNGNETQQEFQFSPHPPAPTSNESASIGTLIDFGYPIPSSTLTVSDSQSMFHSLPQPTPEQISEIEAAVGAMNERMTRIRERTE